MYTRHHQPPLPPQPSTTTTNLKNVGPLLPDIDHSNRVVFWNFERERYRGFYFRYSDIIGNNSLLTKMELS